MSEFNALSEVNTASLSSGSTNSFGILTLVHGNYTYINVTGLEGGRVSFMNGAIVAKEDCISRKIE